MFGFINNKRNKMHDQNTHNNKYIILQWIPACIGTAGRLTKAGTRIHQVNMLPDFKTAKQILKRNRIKQHNEQIKITQKPKSGNT